MTVKDILNAYIGNYRIEDHWHDGIEYQITEEIEQRKVLLLLITNGELIISI